MNITYYFPTPYDCIFVANNVELQNQDHIKKLKETIEQFSGCTVVGFRIETNKKDVEEWINEYLKKPEYKKIEKY